MVINNILVGNKTNMFSTASLQNNPSASIKSINPVFYPDKVTLGSAASPYQLYTANMAHNVVREKYASWSITDHYKVSREEVWPTLSTVKEKIKTEDFTGMSDVDIYTFIEDCFKDAFGDEFYMASALSVGSPDYSPGSAEDFNGVDFPYIQCVYANTVSTF